MPVRVTALLNSYLRLRYLPEALESILDQESRSGFEVVLVTGVPHLEVPPLLAKKAQDRGVDLRTVVIPPGPVGLGLLEGMRSARGEVIAFLDDDDLWAPGKIRAVEDALDRYARLDFFHNSQVFVDAGNHALGPTSLHRLIRHPSSLMAEGRSVVVETSHAGAVERGARFAPEFNNSSVAVRKDLLEEVSDLLPRLRRGEDTFLYLCALARGRQLYLTSDRLTRYRIHREAATVTPTSSPSVTSAYEQFVEGSLGAISLATEYATRKESGNIREWLDAERALWSLLQAVASGDGDRAKMRGWIRDALGGGHHRPRPIDLTASFLAATMSVSPGVSRRALAAIRRVW